VDGQAVQLSSGRWRWADAERSIVALGGSKLEAVDASGAVLRATLLEGDAGVEELAAPSSSSSSSSSSSTARSELAELANIIGGAYRDAYAGANLQTEQAHKRLCEVTQLVCERLTGVEAAYQRTIEERAADTLAMAAGGEDRLTESLLGGLLTQAKPLAKSANGKPVTP
jgi:hypothetical protein